MTPEDVIVSVAEAVPPGARLTLLGLRVAVRPVVEEVAVRLTTPENEDPLVKVTVVVPLELLGTWTLEGLTEILNCRTLTVTVVEWNIGPLLPLMMTE